MARNLFSVCTRFEASQRPECKHGIVRVTGPRERELSVSSGSARHTLDPSTHRRRQQLTLKQLSVEVSFDVSCKPSCLQSLRLLSALLHRFQLLQLLLLNQPLLLCHQLLLVRKSDLREALRYTEVATPVPREAVVHTVDLNARKRIAECFKYFLKVRTSRRSADPMLKL